MPLRSTAPRFAPRCARRAWGACLLGLLMGCTQLPTSYGDDVEVVAEGGLEAANPGDVAIAPLLVMAEGVAPPEGELRKGFQNALVRRRYNPLSIEAVDRRAVNASYLPGQLREDAVLQIVVHGWNDELWRTQSMLTYDLEARLLDAREAGAPVLWSGRRAEQLTMVRQRDASIRDDESLLQEACNRIAVEILTAMPARRPGPEGP